MLVAVSLPCIFAHLTFKLHPLISCFLPNKRTKETETARKHRGLECERVLSSTFLIPFSSRVFSFHFISCRFCHFLTHYHSLSLSLSHSISVSLSHSRPFQHHSVRFAKQQITEKCIIKCKCLAFDKHHAKIEHHKWEWRWHEHSSRLMRTNLVSK